MRLLIVGAGASYQEGLSLNLPLEKRPPLLNQLARCLWKEHSLQYTNHTKLLEIFIESKGNISSIEEIKNLLTLPEYEFKITYLDPSKMNIGMQFELFDFEPDNTPIERFITLEENPDNNINIERFFEFLWQLKLKDPKVFSPIWHNFVLWNLRQPLEVLISGGFIDISSNKMVPLKSTQSVGACLNHGDVVLNLNYDTLLEIGLLQLGKQIQYSPLPADKSQILIAKPHGSMNMAYIIPSQQFGFIDPFCYGRIQSANHDLTLGLVPPRINKSYEQNWIAKEILKPLRKVKPDIVTFWGIGLTDSDIDLIKLYRDWACRARRVEFINPSKQVTDKAQELLKHRLIHFPTIEDWQQEVVYPRLND